jgi:hypothetical protein
VYLFSAVRWWCGDLLRLGYYEGAWTIQVFFGLEWDLFIISIYSLGTPASRTAVSR